MKVLLVGEFSGLHKYLKDGLTQLGIETTLMSNDDGWKKISGADKRLYKVGDNSVFQRIRGCIFDALREAKAAKGYDIIQLIYQNLYWPYINPYLINRLLDGNDKSFLLSAGVDAHILRDMKSGVYKYSVIDNNEELRKFYSKFRIDGISRILSDGIVEGRVNGIIPMGYEYFESHKAKKKCTDIVLFPINLERVEYRENVIRNNRIVVFHGLNREADKGTKEIREACEKVKRKYKDKVEIIITGHLPFEEYCQIMQRANIVIDQCKTYSYGINACIAMGQGKVVLSGAEPEWKKIANIEECPIVNITPNVESIVDELSMLVEDTKKIRELGFLGRRFVERRHNYIEVAKQFVSIWEGTL